MAFYNDLTAMKQLDLIHKTDGKCVFTGEVITDENFSVEHKIDRKVSPELTFEVSNIFLADLTINRNYGKDGGEKVFAICTEEANQKLNDDFSEKVKSFVKFARICPNKAKQTLNKFSKIADKTKYNDLLLAYQQDSPNRERILKEIENIKQEYKRKLKDLLS